MRTTIALGVSLIAGAWAFQYFSPQEKCVRAGVENWRAEHEKSLDGKLGKAFNEKFAQTHFRLLCVRGF